MIIKLILGGFFLLFLHHMTGLIYYFDFHKYVWNHVPGPCRLIPGVNFGSEDMQTLSSGLTFITSGVDFPTFGALYKTYLKKNNVMGRIFLFDFNHPEKDVTELQIKGDNFDQSQFHPHGISVLEDKITGKITLFVVSHPPEYDCIEKFQYVPERKELLHLHTYRDPAFNALNDVAATSEDSFYFTNYCFFRSEVLYYLEVLLRLHWGNLGYFDGKRSRSIAGGFFFPNGITLSRNEKYLYLIITGTEEMKIFKRELDNSLTLTTNVPLYSNWDNPTIELETGNVLSGCVPTIHKTMSHLTDPVNPAGSQVVLLHMDKTGSKVDNMTELFSDDGHTLYGASVASLYKKKLLIGTIIHKLMYCEVHTL